MQLRVSPDVYFRHFFFQACRGGLSDGFTSSLEQAALIGGFRFKRNCEGQQVHRGPAWPGQARDECSPRQQF